MLSPLIQFQWPSNIRDAEYRVFPDEIENDSDILFHGTSCAAFEFIQRDGFKATKVLPSISFARQSSLALSYACNRAGNGVVIAVRFRLGSGLRHEHSIVYLDDPANQPQLVGYCLVPDSYRHV